MVQVPQWLPRLRIVRGAAVVAAVAVLLGSGGRMAAGATEPTKSASPPVIVTPLPPDQLAEAVRAEQDAYIRRLDVCNKLRQVASEKNNDVLLARADELEKLATTLYTERVGRLGVKPPRTAEAKLDRTLGGGQAVNPLAVAPPKPVGRENGRGPASETALREVKP
ncbi:MAG: hypothetical protein ACRCZF_04280 [Gemmataceae bacterium]